MMTSFIATITFIIRKMDTAFSDYSVIGGEYVDGGFSPLAIAIHIVYFDEANELRVKHFVSDSNNDRSNPGKSF